VPACCAEIERFGLVALRPGVQLGLIAAPG
jgi:hypothetical protein